MNNKIKLQSLKKIDYEEKIFAEFMDFTIDTVEKETGIIRNFMADENIFLSVEHLQYENKIVTFIKIPVMDSLTNTKEIFLKQIIADDIKGYTAPDEFLDFEGQKLMLMRMISWKEKINSADRRKYLCNLNEIVTSAFSLNDVLQKRLEEYLAVTVN